MFLTDFEYDGELLSEFSCAIGGITGTSDEPIELGKPVTFNTIKNGDIDYITSTNYDDVLTATLTIIKDPCKTEGTYENLFFDDMDIYRISKWLQKKRYKRFKPIYDEDDFNDIVYYGVFDVETIQIGSDVIGFTLNLTTNAPYAFADPVTWSDTLTKDKNYINVYNASQEIGYLYPDEVIITCHGSGTVILSNEEDVVTDSEGKHLRQTVINNCSNGEVITLDCKNKIIQSSLSHPKLYNDFNYNFPKLISEYIEKDNKFLLDKTSGVTSIDFSITYSPIRKIGVML